ncbi:MAG: hypothetical protein ACRDFX_11265 [Chloroflexota bacterium]
MKVGILTPTVIQGRKDPFSGYHGRPLFSGPGSTGAYVGRVVIELWETAESGGPAGQQARDARGLALVIEPAAGGRAYEKELISRVAACLPVRLSW